MRAELKQRLRQCIAFAQRSADTAFTVAVCLILLLAALLVVIAWYVYKPAIVFVIVVTAIATVYLKAKYDGMVASIRSINVEEKNVNTDRQHLSDHIVHKVVDTLTDLGLASIEETARMTSAVIALIGAFFYLLGLHVTGIFTIILGILLFTMTCSCLFCIRSVIRSVVQSFLLYVVKSRGSSQDDQTTPLVREGRA